MSQSIPGKPVFPALPRLSSRGSTHTIVERGTALADAQNKIKLLEKENRYLQEELELLKKFRVFLKRSK